MFPRGRGENNNLLGEKKFGGLKRGGGRFLLLLFVRCNINFKQPEKQRGKEKERETAKEGEGGQGGTMKKNKGKGKPPLGKAKAGGPEGLFTFLKTRR